MDWNRVEGNWKQMVGKVKEQWGKLTDDDLAQINGATDTPRTKPEAKWTTGSNGCPDTLTVPARDLPRPFNFSERLK